MVEKLWPNDHKVCMEVQSDITFDSKLQFGPFFLQNTPHDQCFSNEALPCIERVCMIIIPKVFILEGKSTIQNWLMIQAKQPFHDDPWLILRGYQALHGTVHVGHGHNELICNFARYSNSH